MRPCPHCGRELPEEMQFCPYCMEKFTEETPVGATPSHRRLWPLWVALAALPVLVLTLWLAWPDKPVNGPTPYQDTSDHGDNQEDTEEQAGSTHAAKQTNTLDGQTDDAHTPTTGQAGDTGTTGAKKDGAKNTANQVTTTTGRGTTKKPCANGHDWLAVTKTVHHEEKGHYETVQNGTKTVTQYKCAVCYKIHSSLSAYYTHFEDHLASSDPLVSILKDRYETVSKQEPVYKKEWVVDQKAYDEIVTVGRRCQRCGLTE